MKRILMIVLMLSASLSVMSQILHDDSETHLSRLYSLLKDSVDFRYSKSFNVSNQGAKFSSINQVLSYARTNKLDSISILIYNNLPAETVYIDTPFKSISVLGVSSQCNIDLSNTVFINRANNISIWIQNLAFASLKNEGEIAYFGFFNNMIEELSSEKNIVFSDIFASEIIGNFNWPSDGYIALVSGKNVGNNFYGKISNIFKTQGDTFIIYGHDNIKELIYTDRFTFSRYLHVTGYLNVQNQISIMNGREVSILRANETALTGNFKVRSQKDSIFFRSDSKLSGVTTPWHVNGDLTVGGEGFAKISKDGTFFIKEKDKDSIFF